MAWGCSRSSYLAHSLRAPWGTVSCENRFNDEARTKLLTNYVGYLISSRASHGTAATMSEDTSGNDTVPLELTAEGITTKIHVKPSYIHKPKAVENLLKNLPTLLTDAVMPATEIQSFSTKAWDLDEAADTIHRYVAVHETDVPQITADIEAASEAENHHPHIHSDGSHMTISCTTHVPPGLSMKDVKLAKLIDKILDNYNIDFGRESDSSEADILTDRQRGREHNMEAVRKSKLACSCG